MTREQRLTIGVRLTEAGDFLGATDLLSAFNNFLRLLSEIDMALSPQFARTVNWTVSRLARSSPAVLELEPIVREEQLDNRQTIIRTAVAGMQMLRERDERPSYFSDQALESARELVAVLGPHIQRIEVFTPDQTIVCTEVIGANIREILHPGREMLGSVEGLIQGMNSHSGFQFSLYEPILATRIICGVEKNSPAELKDRIMAMYEKRVRVTGVLRTNRRGEVRSARVSDVSLLRTEQQFQRVEEISGIYDITGGLEVEEYVQRMRGDD